MEIKEVVELRISQWPQAERPREKLLSKGAQSLSDAELLAIFLRTGTRGKTAVDLARNLLLEFGSLRAVLNAEKTEFCNIVGIGTAKFVHFKAALEIGHRYLFEHLKKNQKLSNPVDSKSFFINRLRDNPHEIFSVLYLNSQHHVIEFEELFRGTLNGAGVHPREVVKRALYFNAAAVIFAHNHPSGIAEPSQADSQITSRLKDALMLVDITVLDHIVVGDGECVSFAERGLL